MSKLNLKKLPLALLSKSVILAVATPVVLATIVSCNEADSSNNSSSDSSNGSTGSDQQPGNGSTGNQNPGKPNNPSSKPPVTPPAETIPTFTQKQLEQSNQLVINNQTWTKITDFNVQRNIQTEVYETYLTRRYKDSFKYPAWNFDFKNIQQGNNGWQDLWDWEYPGSVGTPVFTRAISTAPMIWNERTNFEIGKNDKGESVYAKYNDPKFILNEIKNNQLKQHPAAKTWFEQQINTQTKAITKQFSIAVNALGSTATGLYVAPGEVATLQFSQNTLNEMIAQKVKSFQIIINENFWDNTSADDLKDNGRISKRYPFVKTTFTIDLETLKQNNGEFKFGSPFGGAITIRPNAKMLKPNNNPFQQTYLNYDFTISGALEMLTYSDNVTTEADWNDQIDRVRNGQISAPAMAIDLPLLAMNIPSTGINKFAGVSYDKIIFPKAVAKKWNSFMFVSEFLASRDKNNNFVKLMLRFCDDIWGQGAAAWAGGDQTAMPVHWAADAFLNGVNRWNVMTSNWGTFHEINHNFQQNGALFKKRYHGETDIAIMLNLSLTSDHGRFKNLFNPLVEFDNGEWRSWNQRTSNSFNSLSRINLGGSANECDLNTLLAYQFGSFNLIQYIRNDVYNAPNTAKGWTGFKEIIQLSDTFKVNLWPAMNKFKDLWSDGWNQTPPTDIQKELDRIEKSYKTIDFIGNLYATGIYAYDQPNDQFVYTNDTSAPIATAMNAPYVFDFEKAIVSFKDSVQWNELVFEEKTKLGGTLKLDPTNAKRLIYQPPANVYNQIDEFDIAIKPTNKTGNYVEQYRWKIKMEIVSNLPLITLYKEPKTTNNSANFINDWAYMKNPENFAFQAAIDPRTGIIADLNQKDNQWQRAKISFNFVANETGRFDFKIKGDSWFFIDVDQDHKDDPNAIWWKANKVLPRDFMDTSSLNLTKGETVRFDVYLTERKFKNKLEMQAVVNGNTYDLFEHVTSPFAKASEDLLGFNYLPRAVDQDLFNSNLVNGIANPLIDVINKDQYRFEIPGDNRKEPDQWLAKADGQVWEVWQNNKDVIVNFNQPQTIGAISFSHRTNNHPEARATKLIVKDQNNNILYDDRLGAQYNDRNKPHSIINFKQPVSNISKLTISMLNERSNGFSLDSIQFSKTNWHKLTKIVAATDPLIKYYGPNWALKINDNQTNISGFANQYATTNGQYEYLEAIIDGTGFDIIGQKGADLGSFDLYVNDQLIGDYHLNNPIKANNQILASYRVNDWSKTQSLKIKIVNKTNKPINFDGFQIYNKNVV